MRAWKSHLSLEKLTILQCLYDFWVARHAFNRPIKWRNEKFILGEFAQTANIIHLQVWLGNDNCAILLWSTMQLTISNKKTLFFLCVCVWNVEGRDLFQFYYFFLPTIQLNYSTELPQCNLQYCSIIDAIQVVRLLSWLPGHLSIPESKAKERKRISRMSDLIEKKEKFRKWHNFNFFYYSSFTVVLSCNRQWL